MDKISPLTFYLFLALSFSCTYTANGQSDFSFSLGGGAMYYNGDLSDSRIMPPLELIRPYVGADVSVLLVDRIDISFRYLHGSIEGDDALSIERDNQVRNNSFFSTIDELNVMLRLRAFSVKSKKLINPYGMIGMGYFWFNPKAEVDGKIYELQPLGTEGQFIPNGGYPAPYKLSSGTFAMGLGIFFRLTDQFSIRLEGAPQLTFTDYLDDTSNTYPDSAALAATPNGATAVMLSNRRKTNFPQGGRGRGNPDKNDVIVTLGLSVVYTPGLKNSHSSHKPGTLRKIFKGRKGWWGVTPN